MSRHPVVSLRRIVKNFGRVTALNGLDMDVYADELLVVLGPTGAGKTTLLRLIAGLEQPDAGEIRMDGHDAISWAPSKRDVALVFQNFSLYPEWTVRENMAFPLRAPGRRLDEPAIRERIGQTAQLLHIDHLLDRPARFLSGGEMQRVAIGRAIVRRPRLFLMDEPLTNLDAKLRESLRVELAELRRSLGIPMVFVTHDQAEAMSMGDRMIALNAGEILQEGTPEQIYRHPGTPFIARQLGQPPINLFETQEKDGYWITSEGKRLCPASGERTGRATLGIRPEDIRHQGGELPGEVLLVERMGPVNLLLVAWAGVEIRMMVSKSHRIETGDRVFPAMDPEKIRIWHKEA